jgi:hypothetical protein
MDRTSIRIKNDMTTMISNLTGRKELQVKLWHVKLGSVKSAMTNNRKSTICNLNLHMRRKRTHRTKMSRVMCHVKGGS